MAKTFPFLKGFRTETGAKGGFDLLDSDQLKEVPNVPGVYIIETKDRFRFPYPRWSSRVIYIGMSRTSLKQRLKKHQSHLSILCDTKGEYGMKDNEPWVFSRYQYMYRHSTVVYFYPCKGKQDAKNLEAEIIWRFYEKHRALPVGNGAKSYSKPK